MGKSATGKDTIYHELLKRNKQIKAVIPYTTRPIRHGEKNGREYFFVTVEQMKEIEQRGDIVECRQYDTIKGTWYYFTANDSQIDFSKDTIMISTLEGYVKISEYYGKDKVEPIYIEVDDLTRIERSLKREKEQQVPCVSEVCRRFLADEEDFSADKLNEAGINHPVKNDQLEQCIHMINERMR